MKSIYSTFGLFGTIAGFVWAIAFILNLFYMSHTTNRIMCAVLVAGVGTLFYLHMEKNK